MPRRIVETTIDASTRKIATTTTTPGALKFASACLHIWNPDCARCTSDRAISIGALISKEAPSDDKWHPDSEVNE